MPAPLHRAVSLVLLGCALSACQSNAPPPVAAVAAAPAAVVAPLPTGAGCGPTIARTQAIVDGDVKTGDLSAAVGTRFSADLSKAAGACAAGREGEAMNLLAVAKTRYGYR
ncbi:MAG TPA: hypothetical protein VGU70_07005 [Methylobacterium sp.]|uniref:hypothetical protein n=1 Tax=Methylorubrum sp. B1-46 TaxID=2897334 RepID=UPI001E59100C|nr:hypothetical protein [Methylorubrum sp. B1-46]UGB23967.1 hypothetical protein LPC10_13340 [Methylorubrum sp. B1-46]HEV2542495.1 hypothetical protein [Methylobacterium sp.]